jgi:hypothetical protein
VGCALAGAAISPLIGVSSARVYYSDAVSETLRTIFGQASPTELALVGLFFAMVLGFTWAPVLGEAIGGIFDDEDADDSTTS